MERTVLVLSALLLNALLAGPRGLYGWVVPIAAMPANAMRAMARKLDREHRSAKDREMRGTVCVAVAFVVCLLAGWLLQALKMPFMEMMLVATLLPLRPLWDRARAIYRALKQDNLLLARGMLEGTVWRHHALLDGHGKARAAIEMMGVQLSDKVVAPALWYVVLGLPGLFFSRCLTLMAESLHGRGDGSFTRTAVQLQGVMHWLPARLCALLWVAAGAFALGQNVKLSIMPILTEGNAQAVLMGQARALGLQLGGPMSAYGPGWHGDGHARALPPDLARAQLAFLVAMLFLFVFLGLFL